jgi:hypothetical protein
MQIEQTYEIGLNNVRKNIFFRQCPLHSFWVEQGGGGGLSNKHEKEQSRCRTKSGGREAGHFGSEDGVERATLRGPMQPHL